MPTLTIKSLPPHSRLSHSHLIGCSRSAPDQMRGINKLINKTMQTATKKDRAAKLSPLAFTIRPLYPESQDFQDRITKVVEKINRAHQTLLEEIPSENLQMWIEDHDCHEGEEDFCPCLYWKAELTNRKERV